MGEVPAKGIDMGGQYAIGGAPRPKADTQEIKFYDKPGLSAFGVVVDSAPAGTKFTARAADKQPITNDELMAKLDQLEARLDALAERVREAFKPQPEIHIHGGSPNVVVTKVDPRPIDCRERLIEEGNPHPRSGCLACKKSIFEPNHECPHMAAA